MPNLLKKLRISSVDLCRRGANPLAKIALSKSDDEQWRTRLKELAEDTDAPLTDIADELRAIAAKIGQSAEENAEDEEVVRQHEAVVAKQYAAVCDENELTKRLVQMRAAGGAVISASHNPPEYNGIKFFDAQGFKLPDAVEDEIEAFIVNGGLEGEVAAAEEAAWSAAQAAAPDAPADATSYLASEIKMPAGAEVGVVIPLENACDIYIDHAARSIEDQGISFKGLRIALDTGHGASSLTSPEALRRLGAEVIVINDYGDTTLEEKIAQLKENPALATVPAIQNDRIISVKLCEVFASSMTGDTVEKFARALRDHYDDFNDFMRRNIAEYEVLAGQLPEAFAHPLGQ